MNNELVHTPEGVRDIYGKEYYEREHIEKMVHDAVKSFGYSDITTPTFEFFDLFAKELSATSAKELYKFFDNEGNTLVLRPDFTPSVARCVSKYFLEDDKPIRLCYKGKAFTNKRRLQGKLRESMQMGAELMNDDSVYADAEMIAALVEALLKSGLNEFQVSIGDADYFKGICEEAGISDNVIDEIREQIIVKNYFGAEKIMTDNGISKKYIDQILRFSEFIGSEDALDLAGHQVQNKRSLMAIERLKDIYRVLGLYGISKYVSFDLGMLSNFNYYTGMIFKAYTYGVGDAIATGGRYDNLLEKFGKKAPAVGFMVNIDDLMSALSSQNIEIESAPKPILITYLGDDDFGSALNIAKDLRAKGNAVILEKA